MFSFLDYHFDHTTSTATFRYQDKGGTIFTEKVKFFHTDFTDYSSKTLDRALFLAFIVLGTSYYKVSAGPEVKLPQSLDQLSATFFSQIYQEGLSQYAFENHLTRADLAHFQADPSITTKETPLAEPTTPIPPKSLVLVSGGKDSLLSLEKIRRTDTPYEIAYISVNIHHPRVLDQLGTPIIIRRHIDQDNLKKAQGLNGHVPITLINEALAIVQAILIGATHIELGIGQEGLEPHAWIEDLPVNHQWSKTAEAQNSLKTYLKTHINQNLTIGSCLENLTELEIAKEFAQTCWDKYAGIFSSCNVANYRESADSSTLKWCGKCAKCANSYLLFCPFVPYKDQLQIFHRDLFLDPDLTETFKGLLGVDNVIKPFECIASIDELRWAYQHRLEGYGKLPFSLTTS